MDPRKATIQVLQDLTLHFGDRMTGEMRDRVQAIISAHRNDLARQDREALYRPVDPNEEKQRVYQLQRAARRGMTHERER